MAKGQKYAGYTEAQNRATKKYLSTLGTCQLRMKPEKRELYKEKAAEIGVSLNDYIQQAIEEKIARDGVSKET